MDLSPFPTALPRSASAPGRSVQPVRSNFHTAPTPSHPIPSQHLQVQRVPIPSLTMERVGASPLHLVPERDTRPGQAMTHNDAVRRPQNLLGAQALGEVQNPPGQHSMITPQALQLTEHSREQNFLMPQHMMQPWQQAPMTQVEAARGSQQLDRAQSAVSSSAACDAPSRAS